MTDAGSHRPGGRRVGLFVTCLVDTMRPSVGFAAVKLLEDAGCKVVVPEQTCCGQPTYNAGDRARTKAFARLTIAAFNLTDITMRSCNETSVNSAAKPPSRSQHFAT